MGSYLKVEGVVPCTNSALKSCIAYVGKHYYSKNGMMCEDEKENLKRGVKYLAKLCGTSKTSITLMYNHGKALKNRPRVRVMRCKKISYGKVYRCIVSKIKNTMKYNRKEAELLLFGLVDSCISENIVSYEKRALRLNRRTPLESDAIEAILLTYTTCDIYYGKVLNLEKKIW